MLAQILGALVDTELDQTFLLFFLKDSGLMCGKPRFVSKKVWMPNRFFAMTDTRALKSVERREQILFLQILTSACQTGTKYRGPSNYIFKMKLHSDKHSCTLLTDPRKAQPLWLPSFLSCKLVAEKKNRELSTYRNWLCENDGDGFFPAKCQKRQQTFLCL